MAAEDDPCAIAAWGFASILMSNPLAGIGASPKDAERAQAAIDQGRKIGAKTQRERDYIEAVAAYYEDWANRPERARQLARAKAYEALAGAIPERRRGADLLRALPRRHADRVRPDLRRVPQGRRDPREAVREAPRPSGRRALPDPQLRCAADRRAGRARGAPLRRHRAVGAARAAHALAHLHPRRRVERVRRDQPALGRSVARKQRTSADEALHAMDYMVYAYLQLARDGDARRRVDEARTLTGLNPASRPAGPYALAAMPARYAIERGDWRDAAQLRADAEPSFRSADAMTHFARALGAARSGEPAAGAEGRRAARRAARRAEDGEERLLGRTKSRSCGWRAAAWVALAQRQSDEALALMRQAADIEDKSEKHIVTPGRLLPARELLGDMLLELKRPAEALKEYEASQQREPNRFRGCTARAGGGAVRQPRQGAALLLQAD